MWSANMRRALLCLLAIMLQACSQRAQSNLAVSPDDLAAAWIEAWDSHDVDRILTFYTDDAFYEGRSQRARVSDYHDAYLLMSQLGIVPSLGAE